MIDELQEDAIERMDKSVAALRTNLSRLRTGRAHAGLIDHLTAPYYGADTPLRQVASITVEDARTLAVSPWEANMVQPIEKAIRESGLGFNPVTAGTVIRVPIPELTEERRRELVRVARHEAEMGRVAVRNIRRDVLADIRQLVKEKMASEDEERRSADEVQKITDAHVAQMDAMLEEKEKEIMSI
ncbi:MAG: ribosome recycling factor [Gammaproteobacteria bacterium]|nr:ribosome recycling factor [Gammaproteobacteria bacterium]MXW46654.1 ribosome recycling factor [Gammaproteobacteria bacterium]MYD01461.1 ribosome recycling factor [Gammaproteobacteria bacterium]MYI23891.1 ribosome recycling factor [Gammaproteobacteria bacterium]